MRSYARIEGCQVAEVVHTARPIEQLFHPGIAWLDVTGVPGVVPGWRSQAGSVCPPEPDAPLKTTPPSLDELKARIDALYAELSLLSEAGQY